MCAKHSSSGTTKKKNKRCPGEVAITRIKPREERFPARETTDSGGQVAKDLYRICRDTGKQFGVAEPLAG